MQQPPIDQPEIEARISGHVAELLRLWQAEQGGSAKDRDLQMVSSAIPVPRDRALRAMANALAGYDHTVLLGSREDGRTGDGVTDRGWIDLAEGSGLRTVDVLWRDADVVIVAARKA